MKTELNLQEQLVLNWLNGNINDARLNANGFSHHWIREAFQTEAGYGPIKSSLIADYIKTGDGWQAACDADNLK